MHQQHSEMLLAPLESSGKIFVGLLNPHIKVFGNNESCVLWGKVEQSHPVCYQHGLPNPASETTSFSETTLLTPAGECWDLSCMPYNSMASQWWVQALHWPHQFRPPTPHCKCVTCVFHWTKRSLCTSYPLCNEDVVSGLPYIFLLIKLWNHFSTVMLRYFRAILVTEGGSFSLMISFREESRQRQTAKCHFAGKPSGDYNTNSNSISSKWIETACCRAHNDTSVALLKPTPWNIWYNLW